MNVAIIKAGNSNILKKSTHGFMLTGQAQVPGKSNHQKAISAEQYDVFVNDFISFAGIGVPGEIKDGWTVSCFCRF